MEQIAEKIQLIVDYPKPGVNFRHIAQLLLDPIALRSAVDALLALMGNKIKDVDVVAGLEARGLSLGAVIAGLLQKPFVMLRKEGKTPKPTYKAAYKTEYGSNVLELEIGLIKPGQRVLVVDDLVATGGTGVAARTLINQAGGVAIAMAFLIELDGLKGRDLIEKETGASVHSLFSYPVDSKDTKATIHLPPKKSVLTLFETTRMLTPVDDMRPVLMCHPSMRTVADRVLELSNCRWSFIDWNTFPDTLMNIHFEGVSDNVRTLENRDVTFLMTLDPTTFMEVNCMLRVLSNQKIRSLHFFLPYFPPGTHERVDEEGVLATAETAMKMITEGLAPTKTGRPQMTIFDIHALPERFYCSKDVCMNLVSAIPTLKCYLEGEVSPERRYPTIVFPDDGAYKRFNNQFKDYPMIVCSKIRIGEERLVTIKDYFNWPKLLGHQIPLYEYCIIVDDLAQTGTTLAECAKMLKKLTISGVTVVKKVSAYVTHAVFPKDCWKRFVHIEGGENLFSEFIVTNSNPMVSQKLIDMKPFTILSLYEDIVQEMIHFTALSPIPVKRCEKIVVRVYVASTNPEKLEAVKIAFERMTPEDQDKYTIQVVGVSDIESGIDPQPIGVDKALEGACKRLENLKMVMLPILSDKAKSLISSGFLEIYFVAIENGIYSSEVDPPELYNREHWYDRPFFAVQKLGYIPVSFSSFDGEIEIVGLRSHLNQYFKDIKPSEKTFGQYVQEKLGCKSWFEREDRRYNRIELMDDGLSYKLYHIRGIQDARVMRQHVKRISLD